MEDHGTRPMSAAERRKLSNRMAMRAFRKKRHLERIKQALEQQPQDPPDQTSLDPPSTSQSDRPDEPWDWTLQEPLDNLQQHSHVTDSLHSMDLPQANVLLKQTINFHTIAKANASSTNTLQEPSFHSNVVNRATQIGLQMQSGLDQAESSNSDSHGPRNSPDIPIPFSIYNNDLPRPTSEDTQTHDSDSLSALQIAAFRGRTSIISLLLSPENLQSHAVDIFERDNAGRTALHLAAINGHADTVRLLIQHSTPSPTAWPSALESSRLNHGSDPSMDTSSAPSLHPSHPDLFDDSQDLQPGRSDLLNAADAQGCTPLHCAALQKHEAVLRVLLDAGAYFDLSNDCGWTPLYCCVERGWDAGVRILLDRGADLSLKARKCPGWKRDERAIEGEG